MIAVINLVLGTVLFLSFSHMGFVGEYSILIGAVLANLLCVSMTLLGSAGVNLVLRDMRVARTSIKTELYTSLHTPSRFRGKLFVLLAAISLSYAIIVLSAPVNDALVTGTGVLSILVTGGSSVYVGYRELKNDCIMDMDLYRFIGLVSMLPMLGLFLVSTIEGLDDLSILASGATLAIMVSNVILCKLSACYFRHISRF